MPIWSLTLERLDRLHQLIAKKKAEHDELLAKSEKDLWCADLEEFVAEWDAQIAMDAQIQKKINRMGRRVSKKIGAGGKSARGRDDDDYAPERKRGPKAKAASKVAPEKSAQRFATIFNKTKAKPEAETPADSDNFSDDDFAALTRKPTAAVSKAKPTLKQPDPIPKVESDAFSDDDFATLTKKASSSKSSSSAEPTANARGQRAAAAKKTYVLDEESDETDQGDSFLGDVGAMVKGINTESSADTTKDAKKDRLSLFAMNRPDSSHGSRETLPKLKSKPSRPVFDDDSDNDQTNYEMLARSSPNKSPVKEDDIDSYLSDDVFPPPKATTKSINKAKEAPKPKAAADSIKKRGRPAGSKNKPKEDAPAKAAKAKPSAAKPAKVAAPKVTTLSPAAKAYAAKKAAAAAKKNVFSDDENDVMDLDDDEPDSPAPRAAARSRPGRAAAAKAKPVYFDDSSMALDEPASEDPIDLDDESD